MDYNVCGVPDTQWNKDGKCRACGSVCEMSEDVVIPQRVYEWALKHNMLKANGHLYQNDIRDMLRGSFWRKTPKYFRAFFAKDGRSFASLSEFPTEKMFVVCRDSKNGEFQVGDLVWRSALTSPQLDGINFKQAAGCLEAEYCDEALDGAMFEAVPMAIPERR